MLSEGSTESSYFILYITRECLVNVCGWIPVYLEVFIKKKKTSENPLEEGTLGMYSWLLLSDLG